MYTYISQVLKWCSGGVEFCVFAAAAICNQFVHFHHFSLVIISPSN